MPGSETTSAWKRTAMIDAKNASPHTQDSLAVLPAGRREWIALVAVVVLTMLFRLPFLNTWQPNGDSVNYAFGALKTHVAHSPGSVGYCLLVGLVNKGVGQVFLTMLILSLVSGVGAMVLCYFFAKAVGLRWPAALLAATVYSLSTNTLGASLVCLPHIEEGMFAAWFGVLAVQAMRRRSLGLALGAGVIIALAGSIRPTTLYFLGPAWAYMLWTMRPRIAHLALHAVVILPIVLSWHIANDYYTQKAGYGGMTFDLQVMMPSPYEYASLSGTPQRFSQALPTYHQPWFEVASWLDRHSRLNLLPHKPNWPQPSLKRAGILTLVQSIKFAIYLLLSAPAFLVALLALLWAGKKTCRRLLPETHITWLLTLTLAVSAVFFLIGHLGRVTYLQLMMPAMSVLAVYILLPSSARRPETSPGATPQAAAALPGRRFWLMLAAIPTVALTLCFLVGRPLPSTSTFNRSVNTALGSALGGYGMTHPVQSGRVSDLAVNETTVNPFDAVHTDADFLRLCESLDFMPVPEVLRSRPSPVPPADTKPSGQPK
jgi:hypothetical protein